MAAVGHLEFRRSY